MSRVSAARTPRRRRRRWTPTGCPPSTTCAPWARWAFAELTEIYQIDADFKAKVDREFDAMLARVSGVSPKVST
jgi:hypothetical protein